MIPLRLLFTAFIFKLCLLLFQTHLFTYRLIVKRSFSTLDPFAHFQEGKEAHNNEIREKKEHCSTVHLFGLSNTNRNSLHEDYNTDYAFSHVCCGLA